MKFRRFPSILTSVWGRGTRTLVKIYNTPDATHLKKNLLGLNFFISFRFEYRKKHVVVALITLAFIIAILGLGIGVGYRSSKQVNYVFLIHSNKV